MSGKGRKECICLPLFLSLAGHVMHDFLIFPSLLKKKKKKKKSLSFSLLCFPSLSFLPISFSVVITGDAIKGCNYNGKREILWSEKLINFNQRETENRGRKKKKRYTGKDIQGKRATSLLRESQLDWIWSPLCISLSKRNTLLLFLATKLLLQSF